MSIITLCKVNIFFYRQRIKTINFDFLQNSEKKYMMPLFGLKSNSVINSIIFFRARQC